MSGKYWRVHAIEKSFAVCRDCCGKLPVEVAEESQVCPFCKNRSKTIPKDLEGQMRQAKVEVTGSLERLQEKK